MKRFEPRRRGLIAAALTVGASILVGATAGAAGDLDPSWPAGGTTTKDIGGQDNAVAIAVQADGKIVVAGGTSAGSSFPTFVLDAGVARFNPDGFTDTSFGTGGKVTTDFDGDFNTARGLVIQPDGKIVAVGQAGNFRRVTLTRYTDGGNLDAGFGVGGKVTEARLSHSPGVALQQDGKIVVAAGTPDPVSAFGVARFTSDGAPDTSFGTAGRTATTLSTFAAANSVALQSDGKIVAAGVGESDMVIVRYEGDGSPDLTFGDDGIQRADFGGFDGAWDVAVQADGKIVAAGWAGRGMTGRDIAVARFEADGDPDSTFSDDGHATIELSGGRTAEARGLVIQANGKVVVAGIEGIFSPGTARPIAARLTASGVLDTSFGAGGVATSEPPWLGSLSDVALQADGKLVAAAADTAVFSDFVVARYLGDPVAITVALDVRPGSATNPINLRAKGLVPVAILTTAAFDAASVDPATVCFGDDERPAERDCTEAHGRNHQEDVNGDGLVDLLFHFDIAESGIDPGDSRACLNGSTREGTPIEGCDTIETR